MTKIARQSSTIVAYAIYKDSGVQWIGNIPEHWNVIRVKSLERNSAYAVQTGPFGAQLHADDYVDEGVPLILIRNVEDMRIDDRDIPKVSLEDAKRLSMYRIKKGDIVFSRVGSIGRIAPCTDREEGWLISGQMLRLRITNPRLHDKFATYAFGCSSLLTFIELQSVGSTRESINTEILRNMPLPIPSVEEQRVIAAFLNRETARIDALIEKKQRQIELLREKRSALISHAVTKGIDPNARMKNSDIEWLGEIPEHWDTTRLGRIAANLQTGPFGSQLHASDYVEDGIPIINPSNLQDGEIVPDLRCSISKDKFAQLIQHSLQEGDIVFARRGEMGRCALVNKELKGSLCGTGSIRVRINPDLADSRYVSLFLSIPGVRDHLLLESVGSTMDNLNTSILTRIPIALPPITEQTAITAYIDAQKRRIKAMEERVLKSIEIIEEYRAALISAAVTGKIDVRKEAS
jgi:type I restriction enzyme S subunit